MAVNRACIARLSNYKSALLKLRSLGFKRVFSDNLADAAGVTAAQVRKDFSLFGITGNRRAGYQVDTLIEHLREVLGKNKQHKVIVVGAGRIGQALMQYRGFEAGGIQIAAAFDIDPSRFDPEATVPVLPLERLAGFVAEQRVELAILAVPEIAARQVGELLASAGIRGILNFAPIQLRLGPEVVVGNVNLEAELENLIYFISAENQTQAPRNRQGANSRRRRP